MIKSENTEIYQQKSFKRLVVAMHVIQKDSIISKLL